MPISATLVAPQRALAALAAAISDSTRAAIPSGGVLVRCSPTGDAEQIAIDDWSEAIDEVRRAVG